MSKLVKIICKTSLWPTSKQCVWGAFVCVLSVFQCVIGEFKRMAIPPLLKTKTIDIGVTCNLKSDWQSNQCSGMLSSVTSNSDMTNENVDVWHVYIFSLSHKVIYFSWQSFRYQTYSLRLFLFHNLTLVNQSEDKANFTMPTLIELCCSPEEESLRTPNPLVFILKNEERKLTLIITSMCSILNPL